MLIDVSVIPEILELMQEDFKEPNKRRAFFVIGSEGSGTYMLAEALVAAGCRYNSGLESMPLDVTAFENLEGDIAIRRSIPHGGKFFDVMDFVDEIIALGYAVHILGLYRDIHACAMSVATRKGDEYYLDSLKNQRHATRIIGNAGQWKRVLFTHITYEAFVHSEGFRRWLFEERLGLPYPEDYKVYDGNIKYYEENR